jgi:hypothetical protein
MVCSRIFLPQPLGSVEKSCLLPEGLWGRFAVSGQSTPGAHCTLCSLALLWVAENCIQLIQLVLCSVLLLPLICSHCLLHGEFLVMSGTGPWGPWSSATLQLNFSLCSCHHWVRTHQCVPTTSPSDTFLIFGCLLSAFLASFQRVVCKCVVS